MDKKQLNIFKIAFKRANNGKIDMPNKIDISKIYDIEFYPNGMRNGCGVRFFIGKDEQQNYFLELLASDDHSSWHKQILQNGEIIDLENYKGQFGRQAYDDSGKTEKERLEIQEHNSRLKELFMKCGLERDFDNGEFETKNVIRIRNYGF